MVNVLAVPVVVGPKTARERFAGATNTLTCEGMMRDGKALQMGTSHELGQNFAKPFGIQYLDEKGERIYVWQTSWGASTRMVGGVIMCHGDDHGLRIPPRLAPIQVVVMAIKDDPAVLDGVRVIGAQLRDAGLRVVVDDRADVPFGRRAIDWELKGIPVRLELGPRDLAEDSVTLARRIPLLKEPARLAGLPATVRAALEADQQRLLDEATDHRQALTVDVKTLDEAAEAAASGWARLPVSKLGAAGEAELAAAGVTVRCLVGPGGSMPEDPDAPDTVALAARAY